MSENGSLRRQVRHHPRRRGHLARDLFTLGHLPIVAGIVLIAVTVEEGLLHPADELGHFGTTALGLGIGLYLFGFVVGNLRATGRVLVGRVIALVAATTWVTLAGPRAAAVVTVAGVAVVIAALAGVETIRRASSSGQVSRRAESG